MTMVANFNKSYIALVAPVASMISLELNLEDLPSVLNGKGEEGFGVVLLEQEHKGLCLGPPGPQELHRECLYAPAHCHHC